MNTIPFMLLAVIGWGGLAYVVNKTPVEPVKTVDCGQIQHERDSLQEFLRTITKSDSIQLK